MSLKSIRPVSLRAFGLLSLAVVLLASSSLAQTSGRGVYRMASGAVGVARSQSIHINLIPRDKWFPPCDITPGNYVGTVEMSLADASGRELARTTRRIEGCGIASMSVNADDILRGESRLAVRAIVKLVESGEPDGAPPALVGTLEVSDNTTGKTTVLQGFEKPATQTWTLSAQ